MRAAAFGCSASHAHAAGYYLVRNMQVFPSRGRIKSPSSPTGGKKGISIQRSGAGSGGKAARAAAANVVQLRPASGILMTMMAMQ